jgi:hypothetical protein
MSIDVIIKKAKRKMRNLEVMGVGVWPLWEFNSRQAATGFFLMRSQPLQAPL